MGKFARFACLCVLILVALMFVLCLPALFIGGTDALVYATVAALPLAIVLTWYVYRRMYALGKTGDDHAQEQYLHGPRRERPAWPDPSSTRQPAVPVDDRRPTTNQSAPPSK